MSDEPDYSTPFAAKSSGDVFFAKHFDATAFVSGQLSLIPAAAQTDVLNVLRGELRVYGEKLKTQLVDLLNREYQDFIGLASGLEGSSEAIAGISGQLGEVRGQVGGVRDHVAAALGALDVKLTERRRAEEKRACLESLQEVHDLVKTVRTLLAQCKPKRQGKDAPSSPVAAAAAEQDAVELFQQLLDGDSPAASPSPASSSSDGSSDTSLLLERLARLLSSLRVHMRALGRFDVVRSLEGQVEGLEGEYEQCLTDAFLTAASSPPSDAARASLRRLLRAYVFLDRAAAAEQLVRERLVRPIVTQHVSRDKLLRAPSKEEGQGGGLARMYAALLRDFRERLGLVLTVTAEPAFDFLGNAVWAETAEALTQLGPVLFSTGLPDPFHANYRRTLAFLRDLEALSPSSSSSPSSSPSSQQSRFRRHPSTVAFLSRWNLPVYFSLRFQKLAGAVEAALAGPPALVFTPDGAGGKEKKKETEEATSPFAVDASRALWEGLQGCWAEGVWLEELSPRFLKLALQMVARFLGWLEKGLGLGEEGEGWPAEEAGTETFLALHADAALLARRIRAELGPTIAARLPPASAPLVDAALAPSLSRLSSALPALERRLAAAIAGRACAVLKAHVPTVAKAYRLTNRPSPSAAMPYVADALAPLRADLLTGQAAARFLREEEARQRLAAAVAERASEQFVASASELLEVQARTDSSLRRLQTMRGAAAAASGVSDFDKMQLQLLLDAREMLRCYETDFRLDRARCEGVAALHDFIARQMQQQQQGEAS